MRPGLPLAALLLALSALPARSLDVGKSSPDEFLDRSRAEPGRLHALIIGATWCHACKLLAAGLEAHEASSSTAVGRAAWDEVESDLYGAGKLRDLLDRLRATQPSSLPTVLVLRDGEALGESLAGNNIPKLEAFLAEAERQPARSARKPAKASMLCPGRRDWASYTLGISGYRGPDDASTDDFGRKVLLSFAGPKASPRARLFAPPRDSSAAPGTESARAEDGVFFTASDPIAEKASFLEDVSRSTRTLAALASAPGRELRLILTGHSGEDGMTIGYRKTAWFKDDPTSTYDQDLQLTPREVASAVREASRAGKTVRGLVTTCYAGRYAEAFMPRTGDFSAAPACAAFATLPDKPADGCYSNGTTLAVDYASKLLAGRECGAAQDGRALHYAVAASTSGHDVPLLTSEYFLLYGPAAEFLGRGERAPAPPRSVQRYEWGDGVRAYVDVVSNQVLRAYRGDAEIAPPRLALLDCVADDLLLGKLDGQNASSFYLRPHKTGAEVGDCEPRVALYWDSRDGVSSPSTSVYLEAGYGGWNPGDDYERYRDDFGPTGPTITLEGMRPAARVLLTSVIPAFSDAGAVDDLGGRLDKIAEDIRPYDEPLASALQRLMAEQRGGVERTAVLPDAQKSTDTLDGLSARLKSISDTLELSAHAPPPPVDANALVAAMLDGLSPSKNEAADASLARLAHLAAAAQAELALHEEAKTSPEARRLLAQLETIKTCEGGLY
ncbi:MAG TPA: thioredoxin family protein [Elusimicrobiota bacterium]|nr:thioredoxin family protein [Elusimicrobiota bacterium]